MEYFVNTGQWGSLFAVPVSVVDEYIKLAGGNSLKVLLYVLRNGNRTVTKNEISSALNINNEIIDEAFSFWENAGIFLRNKEAVKTFPQTEKQQPQPVNNTVSYKPPVYEKSSERFMLRPSEVAERIRSNEKIRNLFSMAEESLGRMLNNIEQSSLVWIHEYLGLNIDVILMLVKYLSSEGKGNMAYIEKVAFDWRDKNINTLCDAQNEIQRIHNFSSYQNKILVMFGISTKLSEKQTEIMNEWYEKKINIQLIECAYNRTMDSIGKMSFPYMNSIILTWQSKNLSSVEEIKKYEKDNPPPRKIFGNNYQKNVREKKHTYDASRFESFAINYEELKEIDEDV